MNQHERHLIEKRIARAAVKGLLASGYCITVYDGEEETLQDSSDYNHVMAAMFTTDEDTLLVQQGNGPRHFVLFVYGNDGWDVIADYSCILESALLDATQQANHEELTH